MKYQMWSIRLHVYSSVIAIILQRYVLFFLLFFVSHSNIHKMHWRLDLYYESYCLGFLDCKQVYLETFLQSCDCTLHYVRAQCMHEGGCKHVQSAWQSVKIKENEGSKIQSLFEKLLLKLLRLWTINQHFCLSTFLKSCNILATSRCSACKKAACFCELSVRLCCH